MPFLDSIFFSIQKAIDRNALKGNSVSSLEKLFWLCVSLAFSIVLCAMLFAPGCDYSEGTRSGTVQKISKKGLIWKTWEGELNLGALRSSESAVSPATFSFSVSDEDVVRRLERCERSGQRVTLTYKEFVLRGYKYGSTGYDILDVSDDGDE